MEVVKQECLKKIFNDFSGDLNAIRNKCIGNYAVCIYKNGHITVFGESSACYDIYYYSCDGEWVRFLFNFDSSKSSLESIKH